MIRTLCYKKPASYYREVTEKGLRKCLFYGIHPGGLQVLDDPRRAEAARPLFKKYAPLIQKIARAGWQPITHARIRQTGSGFDGTALKIERFGDKDQGIYFTVRSRNTVPITAEVNIDLAPLGLRETAGIQLAEILERRAVMQKIMGSTLTATVHIEPEETLILTLIGLLVAAEKRNPERTDRVGLVVGPATDTDGR